MKIDSVTRFLQLHAALAREKAALEKRLAYIKHALSEAGTAAPAAQPRVVAPRRLRRASRRRASNALSLTEAIRKVTANKPLTKPEIYNAVRKLGYKFTTENPLNSISAKLYIKGLFKNQKGKFSAAQ